MKIIIAGALAATALTGCVSAPTTPEAIAERDAYRTAWVESRKKANGSVLPGSQASADAVTDREMDDVRAAYAPTAVSDIWE